jgi:hypothetical protein
MDRRRPAAYSTLPGLAVITLLQTKNLLATRAQEVAGERDVAFAVR